ncbi:HAD-IC family P-type ATPase [Leucobacter sp. W1153]|uniref:HAD-IC family P-type ATPase n=1 Tax=Leucobacter sp. W1153 TaxID=3439064 RepID=UPI003F3D15A4
MDLADLGLTRDEAEHRLREGLGNAAPNSSSRTLREILAANVFTLFNAIVFTGFATLLALGRWQDALFGLPALFNTLIGVVQEFQAKRTLDRLAVLNAPTARVLRDGAETDIPLEQVVLGDALVLRAGDQVTADARVIHTAENGPGALELDESLLTGESHSVPRRIGEEVLSGSSVVGGSGLAEVVRVGADSYAASLTAQAQRFSMVRSELRSSVDRLLKWITWALGPVVLIVANGQMQSHGGWETAIASGAWREAVVGAVAAVIAMVPLGLVLVTSIAFAVGAVTLARRNVLIQELAAVEGLARVDVLCLDKTGTITTGEMTLDGVESITETPGWERVLAHLGCASDANSTARCLAERFEPGGRPLEVAHEIPFGSAWKWSGLVVPAGEASGTWIFGAPEFVFSGVSAEAGGVVSIEGAGADPLIVQTLTRAGECAAAGLRTLVLAHSPATEAPDETPTLPAKLAPVALITFRERVRPDAAQTINYFAEQGVGIRIISGDDPRTVAAVAREVGIDCNGGFDARALPTDEVELGEVLEREHVYGRVTPEQKVSLVRALQARGHVVAMTGDGVNDALAIKEADLGIAVDSAAQATKAVSRLVLLDGRFERLPGVVAEGRRVIANIERVSMLFLTKTTYALSVGVIFGLLAWAFPFLPRQLSITDGLTIGIPAFFLAIMPNASRYREGFLRRSLLFAVPSGLIVTAGLISVYLVGERFGPFTVSEMQSASTLTLAGIALWVLAVLSRPFHWFRILIVLAMYAGLAIVWAIPISRQFFEIGWLPEPLGFAVLIIVGVGIILVELLRAWHVRQIRATDERHRSRRDASPAKPFRATGPRPVVSSSLAQDRR